MKTLILQKIEVDKCSIGRVAKRTLDLVNNDSKKQYLLSCRKKIKW